MKNNPRYFIVMFRGNNGGKTYFGRKMFMCGDGLFIARRIEEDIEKNDCMIDVIISSIFEISKQEFEAGEDYGQI